VGVDTSKLKAGDVVHARVQIDHVFSDGSGQTIKAVGATAHQPGFRVCAADIVHVEPRPIKVGDRVSHVSSAYRHEVIAIHENWAWIKIDDAAVVNGSHRLSALSDLTPAQDARDE
jgi:hypothetical protein